MLVTLIAEGHEDRDFDLSKHAAAVEFFGYLDSLINSKDVLWEVEHAHSGETLLCDIKRYYGILRAREAASN